MRTLVLTQGIPGSGKSTWIEDMELKPYTICVDDLRLLIGGPILNSTGQFEIDQKHSRKAWNLAFELLEKRMERGEFVVVDATHTNVESLKRYIPLVEQYSYDVIIVRFNDDVRLAKENDLSRQGHKFVGEAVIDKMAQQLKGVRVPKNLNAITVAPHEFWESATHKVIDLKDYDKMVVFGDLQGTYSPLRQYFQENPEDARTLYVFCGDYVDRGIENHLAVTYCIGTFEKPNFIYGEGNHEKHLDNWANDRTITSDQFIKGTQPQLENAGVPKAKVRRFIKALKPIILLKDGGMHFTITHAGINTPLSPMAATLLPAVQAIKGIGSYELDIDAVWEERAKRTSIQMHGHRNASKRPLINTQHSFNLESEVEFGGHLRIVEYTVKSKSFKTIEIKNDVVGSSVDARDLYTKIDDKNALSQLRANPMIQEKKQGDDGISSFNFKREAFYGKIWNKQTIAARGLFIDTQTGEVVARSYDKFFNLDERNETVRTGIEGRLKFPVTVHMKHNGFLGIAGFSRRLNRMVLASKSTMSGTFRDNFEHILWSWTGSTNGERMSAFLEEHNVSAVFEVIDPVNDPHIVEYGSRSVVLLDVIENKIETVLRPDLRDKLSLILNVPVAASVEVQKPEGLKMYLDAETEDIEGYVIRDAAGFTFKVKTPWYSFWKQARAYKDCMQRGQPLRFDKMHPDHLKICDFLTENPQYLNRSIIDVRNAYQAKRR